MLKRDGTYVYLMLTHVDVWQKPSQNCNYSLIKKKRLKNVYNQTEAGYSPWDLIESDMTEQLPHTYFSLNRLRNLVFN